ncbi:unnamed protein product [Arctia plantaginis]|uniref:Uncharacterized protein n=1 Tax=Arctia plantaginis TaxID=874455 RepID=A0A8S1ADJ6_ARCPL|nr:unnamed protein product [Arctia plantaginis]
MQYENIKIYTYTHNDYSFLTLNSISREETGRLVNIVENNDHIAVEGSYFDNDPDGRDVIVKYTADENGYRIIGSKSNFLYKFLHYLVM